jgi:hypothetical protein
MNDYADRLRAVIHRRLDCLAQIRDLKEEVELLNDSRADIRKEWHDADIAGYAEWWLELDRSKPSEPSVYREWEEKNPKWTTSGDSIRKHRDNNKEK